MVKVKLQARGRGNGKTYVFTVVVEPDEDRWIAYSPLLKSRGAATWGYTREDALVSIQEVLQMTVESMIEHGENIPLDPHSSVRVLRVPVTL